MEKHYIENYYENNKGCDVWGCFSFLGCAFISIAILFIILVLYKFIL